VREMENVVYVSAIDGERFGIKTARAEKVTKGNLSRVLEFCLNGKVSFLIGRCSAQDLDVAQAMEAQGFLIMDTQIYYLKDLKVGIPTMDSHPVNIRPVVSGEIEKIREIASDAFRGYYGHYHADPRLDKYKCDEAYVSWAVRSCLSKEVADEVLVAERDGDLVGFATMRLNNPSEGEGVLFAVSPRAQKTGVYRRLISSGINWCRTKGATKMIVSTQITNFAVQKVWVREGFEPLKALYTFHKWFD